MGCSQFASQFSWQDIYKTQKIFELVIAEQSDEEITCSY